MLNNNTNNINDNSSIDTPQKKFNAPLEQLDKLKNDFDLLVKEVESDPTLHTDAEVVEGIVALQSQFQLIDTTKIDAADLDRLFRAIKMVEYYVWVLQDCPSEYITRPATNHSIIANNMPEIKLGFFLEKMDTLKNKLSQFISQLETDASFSELPELIERVFLYQEKLNVIAASRIETADLDAQYQNMADEFEALKVLKTELLAEIKTSNLTAANLIEKNSKASLIIHPVKLNNEDSRYENFLNEKFGFFAPSPLETSISRPQDSYDVNSQQFHAIELLKEAYFKTSNKLFVAGKTKEYEKLKTDFEAVSIRLQSANTIGTIDAILGNFMNDMLKIEQKNAESNNSLYDSHYYF